MEVSHPLNKHESGQTRSDENDPITISTLYSAKRDESRWITDPSFSIMKVITRLPIYSGVLELMESNIMSENDFNVL